MKRLRHLLLGNISVLFLVVLGFAQAEGQNAPVKKVESEKEQKQELREKACGNESVDYEASTDKNQHPTPEAPSDKAMIYVMRPTMIGFKIDSKLAVDGQWMGVNRGKTVQIAVVHHMRITLEPGEHFFCSESENQSYLALTVEAGKTYYLQQKVKAGIWKARTELVVMDETTGKKKLADVNLSVFTRKN